MQRHKELLELTSRVTSSPTGSGSDPTSVSSERKGRRPSTAHAPALRSVEGAVWVHGRDMAACTEDPRIPQLLWVQLALSSSTAPLTMTRTFQNPIPRSVPKKKKMGPQTLVI